MLRRLSVVFAFLLAALVCAGFVRQNSAPVAIDLYWAALPTTAGHALVVAFLGGALAGVGGAFLWIKRLVRERAALVRKLRLAEGEVRTLRAIAPAHAR